MYTRFSAKAINEELTTFSGDANFMVDLSALAFTMKFDSVTPGHKAITCTFVPNNSPEKASEKLNTKALDAP